MDDSQRELLSHLENLRSDVTDLRLRLAAVEAAVGISHPSNAAIEAGQKGEGEPSATLEIPESAALAPLFGWAFLGMSGAYVLRSATESGTVPMLAGVIAGAVYSGWWLYLAATRAASKPVASTVYALTASLILAPLLWEATVRFHVLSGAAASLVLVAFTAFGLGIGWRHNLTSVASVATFTGLITPIALFRETQDGTAWAVSVLAIAAAVEFSACRDHWLRLRWVAALIADLTVLALTVFVAAAQSSSGRPPVATPGFALGAQIALLAIYLASTADRTLIRRLPITWFEVGQAAMAFLVSVGGALHLAEVTSVGRVPVAVFCLSAAAACYAISFAMLDRHSDRGRNFYTYSTFGLLLAVSGCKLLFSGDAVAVAWAVLAVCMAFAALLATRRTLRVHAYVLIVSATLASGALQAAVAALINPSGPSPITQAYYGVLLAAAALYGGLVVADRRNTGSIRSLEAFLPAFICSWAIAGVAAALAAPRMPGSTPTRTAILVLFALAAASAGVRIGRTELVWLAYSFVAVAGVKLFAEDFRTASSLGKVASLTLFGVTLILLPRIVRQSRVQPSPPVKGLAKRAAV